MTMKRFAVFTIAITLLALAVPSIALAGEDALDEVNAARAARGLRPFLRDPGLTAGAINVADFRAARRIAGHTQNDFAGLPEGARADSAGCAAWPPSLGWGSCCWTENWVEAGAAWAMGSDGLRYMHIFVRGGGGGGGVTSAGDFYQPRRFFSRR